VTGTQRYARELLEKLDGILVASGPSAPSVTILVPPSDRELPKFERLKVARAGRYSGRLWEQFELPYYARGGVLFTPVGGAPLLHRRNIITIHDVSVFAAPDGYSFSFRTWYKFIYWTLCRTALHVLTVSHFSKAELEKWCGADPKQITVTYLGSEHALRPQPDPGVLAKNHLEQFRYVLVVGSRNPNKNMAGVLRSLPYLADSTIQVAIAGQNNVKVFGELQIADERVHDLGYITDSELRTLYENAACFVFPSFYEGFGLPPLEALALGCPTVVAATSSLTELFEGVAFLCNPKDPADIADKITKAYHAAKENRADYRRFASGFRWGDCAKATWDVLVRYAKA
jgi:glycosyltransferase involved in cell wall biosynthesis